MGSDVYGATKFQDGCWLHGVPPLWQLFHPFAITYGNSIKNTFYVPNKATEQCLIQEGYQAKAVGAPILHDNWECDRLEGSILFMPSHGMQGTKTNWSKYIYGISLLAMTYKHAAICVHANDYQEVKALATNITVIKGAQYNDKNALKRQIALFKTFETIAVNAMGSHVFYALYFGCYVFNWGTSTGITLDYLINQDPMWKQRPELAIKYWKLKNYHEPKYMKMFESPYKNVNLGKKMLGYEESRAV